jgi:hypothetical protein
MKTKTDQLLPIISILDRELCFSVAEIVIYNDDAERIIEELLSRNESSKIWKEKLTKCFSENISNYQNYNADYDVDELNIEINEKGILIPDGQVLFHGGFLNLDCADKKTLHRPFATTISPCVALNNSIYASKAYDNNKIELLEMTVTNPNTKAVVLFNNGDSTNDYELEVLFASGLELKVIDVKSFEDIFEVENNDGDSKKVTVSIVKCTIS